MPTERKVKPKGRRLMVGKDQPFPICGNCGAVWDQESNYCSKSLETGKVCKWQN